jgi:ribosomal protein S18 acetylase RimI-like enzyme
MHRRGVLEILQAASRNVEQINAVIEAAKRSWNYDEGYLDAAIPLLKIDEGYLTDRTCFEAHLDRRLVGFAAVEKRDPVLAVLEHLWVSPSSQRRGIGRTLFAKCSEAARRKGCRVMQIVSDPPAEGFYRTLGARRVGERPSRIRGGPVFPILEAELFGGNVSP